MTPLSEIKGMYDVLFEGKTEYIQTYISCVVQDHLGAILWLEGENGVIYNWSKIVVIRKTRG
jgi:hypothetical protein